MPTSGRYQSRFFIFLSEQSLRLRDKTSQTWRQMKIATAWGVQIVLYPVYLAFQTTRLIGRQLQQTARRVWPQLQAINQPLHEPGVATSQPILTADTPIRNLLAAIELLIPSLHSTQPIGQLPSTTTSSPTTNAIDIHPSTHPPIHPSIQSIASLLDTRSLILITRENQILDILTVDQQLQLQRRLIWEMATYWQERRSLAGSPLTTTFLPLPSDRPHALLPIRVFYRLMTWMQTSPIAVAANLFQESRLAMLPAMKQHIVEPEAAAALPTSQRLLRSAELPWLSLQEAFTGLFDQSPDRFKSLRIRIQDWLQPTPTDLIHLPENPPPLPTPHSPPSPSWLTWEDLFGNRQSPSKPASDWEMFDPTASPKRVKQNPSAVQPIDRQPAPSLSSLPEPEITLPTVLEPEASAVLTVADPQPQTETSALSTTWIEAEVKLVTYVKHPLEQVLEWLDRGMLWIEAKIASAVQWLRDRLP